MSIWMKTWLFCMMLTSKASNSVFIEGNIQINMIKYCDISTPEVFFLVNEFGVMKFDMLSCNRFYGDKKQIKLRTSICLFSLRKIWWFTKFTCLRFADIQSLASQWSWIPARQMELSMDLRCFVWIKMNRRTRKCYLIEGSIERHDDQIYQCFNSDKLKEKLKTKIWVERLYLINQSSPKTTQ